MKIELHVSNAAIRSTTNLVGMSLFCRDAERYMSDEIIDMTDASYAGQCHHKVRKQRTQWASQFAVGLVVRRSEW